MVGKGEEACKKDTDPTLRSFKLQGKELDGFSQGLKPQILMGPGI